MVFLLTLIPLSGSGLLLALRRRPPRVRWAAAVGLGVLQLAALGIMLRVIPIDGELTTWAPTSLFHGRILLILDAAGWMLVSSGTAVFTAYLLFSADEARSLEWSETASGFAYLGLSAAAFLAGNLLTVALTWAALDALAYVYLLSRAPDLERVETFSQKFVFRGASTLLIVAGGIPEAAGGGGPVTEALEVSVLSLAVWLRCGLWPIPPAKRGGGRSGLVGLLDEYFPAAMAFAALAHTLGGDPAAGLAWVWILIGGINALFGGLRWMSGGLRKGGGGSAHGLVIAMGGLALLSVAQPRSPAGLDFAWWGAATLVVGSLNQWPRLGRAWNFAAQGLLTLLLLVGPAVVLIQGRMQGARDIGLLGWASGSLILIGSVLAAGGTWRRSRSEGEGAWRAETFARAAALLGLLLPVTVLLADLLKFGALPGRLGVVFLTVGIAGLAVLEMVVQRADPGARSTWIDGPWRAFSHVAGWTAGAAGRLARTGEALVGITGRVLEGSAALLWVLVVVLVVALLATGG